MSQDRHTNRLIEETSPYLLQHAHNPVDWYPWGDEAFARARAEDKPVLLSVGYSACHWCHVMERESFEDHDTAAMMNRLFVSIKVDREERPDVDQIYMQAVQALTGHGGWPMTVFLAPDGMPFYGGTYFPPVDRHGLPAFRRVLEAVADAYRERRGQVADTGRQLLEQMRQGERLRRSATLLTDDVLVQAYQALAGDFDDRHGGFGGAPKFPQPMNWEFLLRVWRRTGNRRALDMVTLTLTRMARGGIYDQLGGGFHRYSVDARWLVPHFEKMLYDNAQLAPLYLHAWLATGNLEFRRVAEETLEWMLGEMRHPAGGFFSAQDADSEGVEGKFFLWTEQGIREALGEPELAEAALAYWGVQAGPNFEGQNILHVPVAPDDAASALGLSRQGLADRLGHARARLYDARRRRVPPGLDDKVLASWNGLALQALAEAGRTLGRNDYLAAGIDTAEFLMARMRQGDRLLRSWKDGRARILGYLEDYAMVGLGLLALYEATFDRRWLDESRGLADGAIRLFWDAESQGFFDTGIDQERLVVRPKNQFDNALPCGTSVAIEWLFRLGLFLGEDRYESLAMTALRPLADLMGRHPSGFGRYLAALDLHLGPVTEVALIWPEGRDQSSAAPLLRAVFEQYRPNRIVAGSGEPAPADLPLLAHRRALDGAPAAYVCRRYVCGAPTADPAELATLLERGV